MSTLTGLISAGGGGINSVQRGTVTGTSTVTISAVDMSKTFVNVSFTSVGSEGSSSSSNSYYATHPTNRTDAIGYGFGYGYGYGYGKAGGRAVLTNSTTLTVTATDGNTVTYYEVVEYA